MSKRSKLAEVKEDEPEKEASDNEYTLNKAERRERDKKMKREAKKQGKELPEEIVHVEETPQAAVLVMPVLRFFVFHLLIFIVTCK